MRSTIMFIMPVSYLHHHLLTIDSRPFESIVKMLGLEVPVGCCFAWSEQRLLLPVVDA